MKRHLLYFLILAVCSCKPNSEIKTASLYYDLNGLIDKQLELLDSVNPVLLKKALISGIRESTELIPNDSIWQKELVIFRNADINKPILSDRFMVEKHAESNQNIITYKSKSPESTKIDLLSIVSNARTGDIQKIVAEIRHGNFLYESAETLELVFKKTGRVNLLSNYRIDGSQNMILKEETTYSIEGEIVPKL